MSEITVIGSHEFTTGFQLIGVKNAVEIDTAHAHEALQAQMRKPEIGILIIDDEILKNIHPEDRIKIENSVKPVVVVLSKEGSSQSLRQSIVRAIGVDLWKEE